MSEAPRSDRILVLDDEPQLLRLMVRILERAGCQVQTAVRGDDAIRLFEDRPEGVDAVVLDMAVEPRGAAEVIDAMTSVRGDLGVVVTSGDVIAPEIHTRLEGCGGVFLRKPFASRALLRAIDDAAGR